ncbi:BRCA1-associated RING domain protein 1-like [Nilaparvata lugens]|nr:BRCA1-associated RING domain protein 1-like [Nilaparvata lugens]
MEADCECSNIIAVLKKIEKIRKCNKCGATELISLTGSCSHSLCSDCLRGLAESICPECSTPFELKAILPNIQWSSFSHEINKIASLVNR